MIEEGTIPSTTILQKKTPTHDTDKGSTLIQQFQEKYNPEVVMKAQAIQEIFSQNSLEDICDFVQDRGIGHPLDDLVQDFIANFY